MIEQEKIFEKFVSFLIHQRNMDVKSTEEYIRELEKFQVFSMVHAQKFSNYAEFSEAIILYKKAKNHSDRTTYKIVSMIKKFLDFCALYDIIESPHFMAMGHSFKKGKSPEREYFDRTEDEEILNKILWNPYLNLRDRCLLFVFFSTGVRPSEMCGLNIGDIDFTNKWIHVKQQTSKTEKERYIPFDESTYMWLCLYMDSLKKTANIKSKDQPLFNTKDGNRMKPGSIWKLFFNMGKELDIKMNPYKWRHSFASFVVQQAGLAPAAKLMGHDSISTTMIYTHYKPAALQKIYNDITAPIENGRLKIAVPEIISA